MKQLWRNILISALTFAAIHLPAAIPAQTTLAIRGGLSRATLSGVPTEGVPESALKARTGISLGAFSDDPGSGKPRPSTRRRVRAERVPCRNTGFGRESLN